MLLYWTNFSKPSWKPAKLESSAPALMLLYHPIPLSLPCKPNRNTTLTLPTLSHHSLVVFAVDSILVMTPAGNHSDDQLWILKSPPTAHKKPHWLTRSLIKKVKLLPSPSILLIKHQWRILFKLVQNCSNLAGKLCLPRRWKARFRRGSFMAPKHPTNPSGCRWRSNSNSNNSRNTFCFSRIRIFFGLDLLLFWSIQQFSKLIGYKIDAADKIKQLIKHVDSMNTCG